VIPSKNIIPVDNATPPLLTMESLETMEKETKKDHSGLSNDEKKALNDAVELTFNKVKDELKAKWLKEGYSVVILLRRPPTGLLEITVNGRKMGSNPEEEFKSPCDLCGKSPCKVQQYMDCYCIFVKYYINEEYKDLPNNEKRKLIYRKLNEKVRGVRGKYNRNWPKPAHDPLNRGSVRRSLAAFAEKKADSFPEAHWEHCWCYHSSMEW